MHLEKVDLFVLGRQLGVDVVVLEAHAVAGEHVEELVLRHHAALADVFDELVWKLVISAEWDVGVSLAFDFYLDGGCGTIIVEDGVGLNEAASGRRGLVIEHIANGCVCDVYVAVIVCHNLYKYIEWSLYLKMKMSLTMRIWWLTGL